MSSLVSSFSLSLFDVGSDYAIINWTEINTSELTGPYVPYTGAVKNVDLGINNLSVGGTTILGPGTNVTQPLYFKNGSLLTTPVPGSIEYDGERYYLTETDGIRRVISLSSDVVINTITAANTTLPVTLYNISIQPEDTNGKYYKISLFGLVRTASAADSFSLNVTIDGSQSSVTFTPRLIVNQPWHMEYHLIIRQGGETGTYAAFLHSDIADESYDAPPILGSINTTIPNNIIIKIKWNAAKVNNDFKLYGGGLEDLN